MTENKKETLILLDAHAIIHRAYHALPEFSSPKGEPTGALYGLSTMLMKVIDEFNPEYMVACFDMPEPTYRHKAYEEYKSGRKKTDDALISQLERAKDVFNAFGIPIYESSGFEADDIIGTLAEQTKKSKNISVIIASGDMDTMQLVDGERVQVYTLKKGIQDTVIYNEEAVKKRFDFTPELLPDFKGLRGDPSDNIPGVSGIGEKTATTLITSFGDLEKIYKLVKKNPEKLKEVGIKERIINLLLEQEEEAFFSRELASIRIDAPIELSLKECRWREVYNEKEALDMFSDLGFRSLIERFKKAMGNSKELEESNDKDKDFPSEKKKELAVMVWLLDSNLTQPSEEDILNFTKSKNLSEAYKKAEKEIKENSLSFIYEKIEKPLIKVIDKMHEVGVLIDKKKLSELKKEYSKEMEEVQKEIWEKAGEEFNISSPKQLGEILFDKLGLLIKGHKKTSTGARSTKESELIKLQGEHLIIDDILLYREISKLLSTYIEPISKMTDSDGRLRAEFSQTGTTTGRLSSNHPNLQNIPVNSERGRKIRGAFISEKEYSLFAFDYSQIELRIAAILSGDEKLNGVFSEGGDIHTATASEILEVSPSKVDSEMRRKAKVINFGILYGMGVNALKANLGTTQSEAREYLNKYFEKFSTLAKYIDEIKTEAHRKGYTETLFGRRRYVTGLNSHIPYIRAGAERAAINAPIQGTSADIIKRAMVLISEELEKNDLQNNVRLLMQVHDELIYEIKDSKREEVSNTIKKIMENILKEEKDIHLPIDVKIKRGGNWNALKETDTK